MNNSAYGEAFVGRERELSEIEGVLGETATGQGALFLVSGEAGMGKTRLAEEAASRAATRGFRVFWGQAWEGEGAPAFWPWIQVLRRCVRESPAGVLESQPGPVLAHLAELVPEIRSKVHDVPAVRVSPDSEEARFPRFEAVATYLESLSRQHPHLLVLDDLQWADRASLLLLEVFSRRLGNLPLILFGTIRQPHVEATALDPELTARLLHLGRHLSLEGLSQADLARFVGKSARTKPADDFLAALRKATNGNPFFVVELLRWLATRPPEARMIHALTGSFPLPATVRAVVRNRISVLPEGTRQVLGVSSVIGTAELDPAIIERVCERPAAVIEADLDPAVEAGIVIRGRKNDAKDVHAFSHGLVRETLYDDLRPAERADLHRRVGEAIEELCDGALEAHLNELAHHFVRAVVTSSRDTGRAVRYSRRAGERALGLLAYEKAVRHFEQALAVLALSTPGNLACRVEVLLALGEARRNSGLLDGSRDAFREAASAAKKLQAPELLARAALGFSGQYGALNVSVVDDVRVTILESALEAIGTNDDALRARLLACLADALGLSVSLDRRRSLVQEALDLARRAADPNTLAHVLNLTHMAAWGRDDLGRRIAAATELTHLAEAIGDRRLSAAGHNFALSHFLEAGDRHEADQHLEIHQRQAKELREPYREWIASVQRAMFAFLDGRLDESEDIAREALAVGQEAQNPNALQLFGVQLLFVRREQARLDELLETVAAFCEGSPHLRTWRCILAWVYAEIGRPVDAAGELDLLMRDGSVELDPDLLWLPSTWALAEVVAKREDVARAEILYDQLLPFEDRCMVVISAVCGGSISRLLGVLAETLGCLDEAAGHFERALRVHARMHMLPWLAHTRYEYGRVLLRRGLPGDGDRGRKLLDAAVAIARELRMTALEKRISALHEQVAAPTEAVREGELRRTGGGWTIRYEGVSCVLPDSKGLHYLAELLVRPGRQYHAVDLVASVRGTSIQTDRQRTGLSERARKAVGNRIRAAITQIDRYAPTLAEHLRTHVRMGKFCVYEPPLPVRWLGPN